MIFIFPQKIGIDEKSYDILIANIFGVWHNSISTDEYKVHIKHLNNPEYYHNRGQAATYDQEKWNPEKNRLNDDIIKSNAK